MDKDLLNQIDSEEKKFLRFVCISDTHTKHRYLKLPKGDVLLHAGDFTFGGRKEEVEDFSNWLKDLDFKYKVVIAGNHEVTFDLEKEEFLKPRQKVDFQECKSALKNCIYLEDSSVTIGGIKIYGSPHQPPFHDWGFNREEEAIKKIWSDIPEDTDILITHGPPYDILDLCVSGDKAGCPHLRENILERVKPKYHIFGHIHEDCGQVNIEGVEFINASSCNFRYKPVNKIYVFDLETKEEI